MSIRMLDYLLEDNGLWPLCEAQGLCSRDLIFIKELILGHPIEGGDEQGDNKHVNFQGRSPNKHFLYQVC